MTMQKEENYTVKVVTSEDTGALLSQAWYDANGKENNPNGPALIVFEEKSGQPKKQVWMADGVTHRPEDEGPAVVEHDYEEGIVVQEYFFNDRLHRNRGPAILIKSMETGQVLEQRFFRHGIPYRPWEQSVAP